MGVNKQEFNKAMAHALQGSGPEAVTIDGHGFNVKKVQTSSDRGGNLHVKGQLSHRLNWRDDDQLYYSFDVRSGQEVTIDDVHVTIDASTLNSVLSKAWDVAVQVAVEWIEGQLSDDDTASTQTVARLTAQAEESIYQKSLALVDGSWQGAARFLIVNIAGRLALPKAVALARRKRRVPGRGPVVATPGRVVRDHLSA